MSREGKTLIEMQELAISRHAEKTKSKENPVVSIQVQTTRLTGGGVEVVSRHSADATHWSLYLRRANGLCEWQFDIYIHEGKSGTAWGEAMIAAAKLSMEHKAFIEKVQ